MAVEDTLIYPSQGNPAARTRRLRTIPQEPMIPGWSVNQSLFEYQGSCTIEVRQNDHVMGQTGDVLGIFAGTECRGIAIPVSTPNGIRFFLQVWSNVINETLALKFYHSAEGVSYTVLESIVFSPDMIMGTIAEPHRIQINAPKGSDTDTTLLQELITLRETLSQTQEDLTHTQQALTQSNDLLSNAEDRIMDLESSLLICKLDLSQVSGYTIDLEPGWHLIGGTNKGIVPVTDIEQCIEVMYIFENGQYIQVDNIPAYKGVWIKVREACRMRVE